MKPYKKEFIESMVKCGALSFGKFITKSGRETPYFINIGCFQSGSKIKKLSEFYTNSIVDHFGDAFDVLFGPAYKGIPLSVATAMTYYELTGKEVGFCFNRKEAKDHGEGGDLVGYQLQDGDRVLIIEDVTTAGTSIKETVPMLKKAAKIELAGLVVSVDRLERGNSKKTALTELGEYYNMATFAIVTIDEVIQYLVGRTVDGKVVLDNHTFQEIQIYWDKYCGRK